jgi:hypothetical protein
VEVLYTYIYKTHYNEMNLITELYVDYVVWCTLNGSMCGHGQSVKFFLNESLVVYGHMLECDKYKN